MTNYNNKHFNKTENKNFCINIESWLLKVFRNSWKIIFIKNLIDISKPWEFQETLDTSADWQVVACPSTRKKELSRKQDPSPILSSSTIRPELEESELEEETINSELCALRKETSTGPLNQSLAKLGSSMLSTMHQITNWSGLKLWWKTASSPLMLHLSPLGIWTTTVSILVKCHIIAGKKTKDANVETTGKSQRAAKRIEERQKDRVIDPKVSELFSQQRLYACISSRPGQSGRADGYILEGKELEFYAKKIESRKKWCWYKYSQYIVFKCCFIIKWILSKEPANK